MLKLDYSLTTSEERNALVSKLLSELPEDEHLSSNYLEYLADYIIFSKEDKKEKDITSNNRLFTIKRHETSFEGICEKMEFEDGIYNMVSDLGKHEFLIPKDPLTEQEIAEIPELKELRENIAEVEAQCKKARGKKRHLLTKQLVQMRQDQYVIRCGFRGGKGFSRHGNIVRSIAATDFYDDIYLDENNEPVNRGPFSFFNPKHIEALLCNYSQLKQSAYGDFEHDLWYMMEELDNLIEMALRDSYPIFYSILIYKIDGLSNLEIQEKIAAEHGVSRTVEYISAIWRQKIPKLIAEKAKEKYLIWYYTYQEKGQWKKCNRCGQIKLAHSRFFPKNSSSKDGWYSLCKECRSKAQKGDLDSK